MSRSHHKCLIYKIGLDHESLLHAQQIGGESGARFNLAKISRPVSNGRSDFDQFKLFFVFFDRFNFDNANLEFFVFLRLAD